LSKKEDKWWKLLDWSQMKTTLERMKPDLRNKIEQWLEEEGKNK